MCTKRTANLKVNFMKKKKSAHYTRVNMVIPDWFVSLTMMFNILGSLFKISFILLIFPPNILYPLNLLL